VRSPLIGIAKKEFIQTRRDKATIYMVFVFLILSSYRDSTGRSSLMDPTIIGAVIFSLSWYRFRKVFG
jgi:hypothetical protein